MINTNGKEYKNLNDVYEAAFGNPIPLMMIPEGETLEGLKEVINKSISEGKNLLPERYEWDDSYLY